MSDIGDLYKEVVSSMTNFVVGTDDFSNLEIRSGNEANRFFYLYDNSRRTIIKNFVLETSTSGKRTVCSVTFVEKDGSFTPRLILSRRNKLGDLEKELVTVAASKAISSRIDLGDCHENYWRLMEFIRSIKEVEMPRSGMVAVSSEDKQLLANIQLNRHFVQKVLATFNTPDAQDLLVQAKKHDVRNLHASVKQAKNKQALIELEEIISGDHTENQLQVWINENTWVFGIEYIRKLDLRTIGIGASVDFAVESLDGYADVIELKKADVERLFIYDQSHDSYYTSSELAKAVGQGTNYIKIMEENTHQIMSKYGAKVLKPRAKIVVGRSINMVDKEREALRVLNDSLHGIEILTYDEIKRRAETIVEVYDAPEPA